MSLVDLCYGRVHNHQMGDFRHGVKRDSQGRLVCGNCDQPVQVTRDDPRAKSLPGDEFYECRNEVCAASRMGRQPLNQP